MFWIPYLIVCNCEPVGANFRFEVFYWFRWVTLFVGEFQGNRERRTNPERAFELTDVEPDRLTFSHRELNLVTWEIPAVESSTSSVAETHLIQLGKIKIE